MDRLLSTVLLALTLAAERPYLLVDGAPPPPDQPAVSAATTHAPSLPQGKYAALSVSLNAPDHTRASTRRLLLTISLSRRGGAARILYWAAMYKGSWNA